MNTQGIMIPGPTDLPQLGHFVEKIVIRPEISLRAHIATQMMAAIVSNDGLRATCREAAGSNISTVECIAITAVGYANALIAELEKQKP